MKKILVIEDDAQVRDNIQDILSLEDFFTITAADGSEGLSLAQEELPDLIICDVMMPELNGYEVLANLRKTTETETIPFIFLTAKADRTALRQGMALGADDYLTKPFTPLELRQAIVTRLEKQVHLEQQAQRQLDELRQNIAHSLPHELNTPLGGILNGVELLRYYCSSVENPEVMELLGYVEQSGKRLYQLIQNFITYTDLELLSVNQEAVATLRAESDRFSSMPLVESIAIQKAEHYQRLADLELDLQDTFIKISETKFHKAVEEVIDNAFKFSKPGSVVRVTSSVKDNLFHLFVIDHGRGMTSEQIAKVGAYVQFQRRLYEQQGAGLGLEIAKRVAELYGGELVIESFPGQQTIVRITVPALQRTLAAGYSRAL